MFYLEFRGFPHRPIQIPQTNHVVFYMLHSSWSVDVRPKSRDWSQELRLSPGLGLVIRPDSHSLAVSSIGGTPKVVSPNGFPILSCR